MAKYGRRVSAAFSSHLDNMRICSGHYILWELRALPQRIPWHHPTLFSIGRRGSWYKKGSTCSPLSCVSPGQKFMRFRVHLKQSPFWHCGHETPWMLSLHREQFALLRLVRFRRDFFPMIDDWITEFYRQDPKGRVRDYSFTLISH